MKKMIVLCVMSGLFTACASIQKNGSDRTPQQVNPQQVIGEVDKIDPATDALDKEQKKLAAELTPAGSEESIYINEVVYVDPKTNVPTKNYYPAIVKAVVQKANDKKSRLYKYLRLSALSFRDGQNPGPRIKFPISSAAVKILGPAATQAYEKTQCRLADNSDTQMICGPTSNSDQILVGIPRSACHNAGCDSDLVLFSVEVNRYSNTTVGEAPDDPHLKIYKKAYVEIKLGSAHKLDQIQVKNLVE